MARSAGLLTLFHQREHARASRCLGNAAQRKGSPFLADRNVNPAVARIQSEINRRSADGCKFHLHLRAADQAQLGPAYHPARLLDPCRAKSRQCEVPRLKGAAGDIGDVLRRKRLAGQPIRQRFETLWIRPTPALQREQDREDRE